jgi:hypothetical protein
VTVIRTILGICWKVDSREYATHYGARKGYIIIFLHRTALVLSHVPWLGKYYVKLPGIGEDLKKFRMFCQERATLRRSQGSQSKDLFHYLVILHLLVFHPY